MSKFEEALDLCTDNKLVVMVMGMDQSIESEGRDRGLTNCYGLSNDMLGLPGCQSVLVERATARSQRVILVIINGGPISMPDGIFWSDNIAAIVEAFYPGAQGGTAVADVLFGLYNPAGRMPVSILWGLYRVPAFTNYNMTGRTYRNIDGDQQYLFGILLSV